MRTVFIVQHAIHARLYPNKTQQLWADCNIQNTNDFHNYLYENVYEEDVEINEETGEEREVTRINWDIINSKNGLSLLQTEFQHALRDVPEDKLRKDRHGLTIHEGYRTRTIANIYDQVRNDVHKNFTTFYKLGRGKPKYKNIRNGGSFRIPQSGRDLHLERRSTKLNHGTEFDFQIHDITNKHSSKLSHNLGWLHIPSCGASNPDSDDFIKCFCPCNLSKEDISSITITRTPTNKYYASIVLRKGRVYLSKKNALSPLLEEKKVGVDMNVSPTNRVVTSTLEFNEDTISFEPKNEVIKAPTPYKSYFSKLRKEQRKLSRKAKFSKKWYKQKVKVAKVHEKISNIRLNFNRQVASYLTTNYNSITIEDLSISQMKRGQPKWFQKLYNDANLYQLKQCIRWSCLKSGRTLFYVSPKHTSKTCNTCGYVNHKLKLGVKQWTCPKCNTTLHRDKNASSNIYDMIYQTDKISDWEISNNKIYYDGFHERKPVTNPYFIENLAKRCKEEVQTVSA